MRSGFDCLPFNIRIYIIVQRTHGQLDLLLHDTITAIREIGYDTQKLNRYRYEETD